MLGWLAGSSQHHQRGKGVCGRNEGIDIDRFSPNSFGTFFFLLLPCIHPLGDTIQPSSSSPFLESSRIEPSERSRSSVFRSLFLSLSVLLSHGYGVMVKGREDLINLGIHIKKIQQIALDYFFFLEVPTYLGTYLPHLHAADLVACLAGSDGFLDTHIYTYIYPYR